jgi:hypothetical protein
MTCHPCSKQKKKILFEKVSKLKSLGTIIICKTKVLTFVLHGFETWSGTQREVYELQVLEKDRREKMNLIGMK